MPEKRKKYYWCSCAFILWLDEKGNPLDIEGLAQIVAEVESGHADIFTSAFTRTEVLEGKMNSEQKTKFTELFQQKNVVQVDVSTRVLDMSEKIRNWNPKISSADAIHLATAVLYEADEFHTTDGGGKRKRAGDLLPLNGNIMGYPLKICKPRATQGNLFTKSKDDKAANEENTKSPATATQVAPTVQGSSSGHPEGQAGTKTEASKTPEK